MKMSPNKKTKNQKKTKMEDLQRKLHCGVLMKLYEGEGVWETGYLSGVV